MRARQTLAWRAHRPVLRPPRRPPRRLPFAPAAPRFGQRALPSGNRRDVRSRRPPPRATHPGLRPPPRPSPLASEETRRETRPLRRQIIIRATTQRSGGFPTADFGAPVHSQPCPSRCRPIPQIEGRKITGRKIFRRIPARTLSGSLPKNSPTPPRPSSNPPPRRRASPANPQKEGGGAIRFLTASTPPRFSLVPRGTAVAFAACFRFHSGYPASAISTRRFPVAAGRARLRAPTGSSGQRNPRHDFPLVAPPLFPTLPEPSPFAPAPTPGCSSPT